jgi:thioredoxin-like negative regulator of GroEL
VEYKPKLKPTNNALQVFFIYADNCRDCDKILTWIEEIAAESKIPLQLLRFRYDQKEALNIAVTHNIDDLPGIVIGKTKDVFQGKKVSQSQLKSAMIKAWKSIGEPK